MKEISIKKSKKVFVVDDEDFIRTSWLSWSLNGQKSAIQAYIDGRVMSIGKYILETTEIVDHKDRNIYNNQKYNLRIATQKQNNYNKGPREGKKYKGTYLDYRNKWVAMMTIKGRNTYLGSFDDEIEAAKTYDKFAKVHYGEFAYLNFPEEIV